MFTKIHLDDERLRSLYVDARMTCLDVGKLLGVSKYRIWSQLVEMGIERRSTNIRATLDADAIQKMYETDGLSAEQIARKLCVTRPTIVKVLKASGIPIRGSLRHTCLRDRDWLAREYETKSAYLIAREVGCAESIVQLAIRRVGIAPRDHSESQFFSRGHRPSPRKGQPRTIAEIERIRRSVARRSPKIKARLAEESRRRWKNPDLLARVSGPNSVHWNGGSSNAPYPVAFTRELRRRIRERDEYRCRLCPTTQADDGRALSVHHIDYDKDNVSETNLISLCIRCHTKTNHNREHWMQVFSVMLADRDRKIA